MDNDPDQRCMERLRRGDDRGLNDLMQRWKEPLVSFCFRYTGNETDAREIAHETFVNVYSARDRYRPVAAFSTWLFTIAVNLCQMRNRWRRRHPEILETDRDPGSLPVTQEPASSNDDPAVNTDLCDLARDLERAIRGLPHDLRVAFILHELQGKTCREIAAILNASEKAVERRLARARDKLRARLQSKWGEFSSRGSSL